MAGSILEELRAEGVPDYLTPHKDPFIRSTLASPAIIHYSLSRRNNSKILSLVGKFDPFVGSITCEYLSKMLIASDHVVIDGGPNLLGHVKSNFVDSSMAL
ncbi:hypothetical protein SELMODRAFT_412217 [Selaginella moellendorffii]|uniref:Uncharacterized protein n=1 Tax=Selaginella moellendorffii TaxID=88036 RepID=D8RKG6_SELML|nr:hypothetical protein SELMODRAFT_412217 [Selaginella moellendorffii]